MATRTFHYDSAIADFNCSKGEEFFVSITPGRETGPAIIRDGILPPRAPNLVIGSGVLTTDPVVQRAGTWTIYNHLKDILEKLHGTGDEWLIVGAQGLGDQTMNEYHVVFRHDITTDKTPKLSLASGIEDKPTGPGNAPTITIRRYPSLVKHNDSNVTFEMVRYQQNVADAGPPYRPMIDGNDVSNNVQLIVSGKHIVQNNQLLSPYRFVEHFQDVRHIFKTPQVRTQPIQQLGIEIDNLWFGENVLYSRISERRAALVSPIDVPLMVVNPDFGFAVPVDWSDLATALSSYPNYYREVKDTPPERAGEWRRHPEKANTVEIFFKRNVYSFSSVGLQVKDETNQDTIIVGHVSGGSSGRVGTSVEAVAENMIGYGYCSDAMIMDEGFDVFQLINPESDNGYRFTNEEILRSAAALATHLIEEREPEVRNPSKVANLNETFLQELDECLENSPNQNEDFMRVNELFPVQPLRAQIRTVLVFAKRMSG